MPRFSANLGLLWADLPLPDAIRAAKAARFDAVEVQWPYAHDAHDVKAALDETGLDLLSLNTPKGDAERGDFGLAAHASGADSIATATDYAEAVNARAIHVLPGIASGSEAWATFEGNVRLACDLAPTRTILIEPINPYDVPGYLLHKLEDAIGLIERVNKPNLKLMFDFYHIGRMHPDPIAEFTPVQHHVGHIQFASIPDRAAPNQGMLDYAEVFAMLDDLGWNKPLGAEYRPYGKTEASLGWMKCYRRTSDD